MKEIQKRLALAIVSTAKRDRSIFGGTRRAVRRGCAGKLRGACAAEWPHSQCVERAALVYALIAAYCTY